MAANPACVGRHRAQDPIQTGSPCKALRIRLDNKWMFEVKNRQNIVGENMKRTWATLVSTLVAIYAAFAVNAQSAANPPLKLIQSIPLPGQPRGEISEDGRPFLSTSIPTISGTMQRPNTSLL